VSVVLMALLYCAFGFLAFIELRYWIPLVMPVAGAVAVQHVCLVVYQVVFEEREQRRIKSVFSKVVNQDVMTALLGAENLAQIRSRREATILFADVRGFTELTDSTQALASDYVRDRNLSPEQAEACYDEFARETLATVNAYLNCVIESAMKEKGTYDKLIGDCVMFFWGAPLDHSQHALACVRAAIDAQRSIHRLNQQRALENQKREIENRARQSAGLPPRPPLATLSLGTGINTGMVTAGIMGDHNRQVNFTVFGREVNLASRLEGISGRGRIFISESTYNHLKRDDPTLAATCIEREPTTPKGFNKPVRIFEVPWLPAGEVPPDYQTMMFAKAKQTGAAAEGMTTTISPS
jgi:adenylate cyclase